MVSTPAPASGERQRWPPAPARGEGEQAPNQCVGAPGLVARPRLGPGRGSADPLRDARVRRSVQPPRRWRIGNPAATRECNPRRIMAGIRVSTSVVAAACGSASFKFDRSFDGAPLVRDRVVRFRGSCDLLRPSRSARRDRTICLPIRLRPAQFGRALRCGHRRRRR